MPPRSKFKVGDLVRWQGEIVSVEGKNPNYELGIITKHISNSKYIVKWYSHPSQKECIEFDYELEKIQ